jgi:hypothetical protein
VFLESELAEHERDCLGLQIVGDADVDESQPSINKDPFSAPVGRKMATELTNFDQLSN